jgi:hypothetical protein
MTQEILAVSPDTNPESQEYIDAMVAKGTEAVNNGKSHAEEPVEEIAPKPEGIPDKFYNETTGVVDYASLAKSYAELEKRNSAKASPKEEVAVPVDATEASEATQEDASKTLESVGLDFEALSNEYGTEGGLTDKSYKDLAKAGIPKGIVDAYINGQLASVQVARTQVFAMTDGEAGYNAMVGWATANTTPKEIASYNKAVNSGNESDRELAVRGLWSRYGSTTGNSQPSLVTGSTKSVQSGDSFKSRAEMMAAMGDPRYKSDNAFRKNVETKLSKSDIF